MPVATSGRAMILSLHARAIFVVCSPLVAGNGLAGCTSASDRARDRELPFEPAATLVELMDSEIDPAADALWASVASITNEEGFEERQPRTDDEWLELRRRAITLAEASNLVAMKGRRVTAGYVAARAAGELDSAEAQRRIDANPDVLRAFANALHETSVSALHAIDAKDPAALLQAGGAIDAACEACHLSFWYPDSKP